jgi:hypothetical protein
MHVVKKKAVRGEKLRDLLLYVYMHNQFSKEKMKVADLKKIVDYSAGGVYSAFESPYLEKIGDEIRLTQEGKDFVRERILPQYEHYKSYGNLTIVIGIYFLFQWFEWTYFKVPLVSTWYFAALIIGFGIFLRFFILRFNFFITRKTKRLER